MRWRSVIFWSVISAAFIGPGTVATAAAAGAGFRMRLAWALVFSTAACLVLQEAAARLTIVSGRDLGEALRAGGRRSVGRLAGLVLVLGAVVVGCAAYEAGNLLGGAAGAVLAGATTVPATLAIAAAAAALLATGRTTAITRALAAVVVVMGAAFVVVAWRVAPAAADVARGAVTPAIPPGSTAVVLGLVGTTVVPYNLFLGSGLARGQRLPDVRFGLAVSVVLGGCISLAVMVAGTAVEGAFGFDALARVLESRLGGGGSVLLAVGLLAAGASSAVTAPLAAAVTTRGLFAREAGDPRWADRGWRFRAVWGGVLATGLAFGLAGVRPVPAIVLAQAFNGVVLPVAAVVLALAVNDRRVMGERLNGIAANVVLVPVVAATFVLGASGLARAAATALGLERPTETATLALAAVALLAAAPPIVRAAIRRRRASAA